jgi:diaminopimelate decarboxylase
LYGPLCMNIDVMRHSAWLPPLRNGDAVVFNPVGAYNNTQWQEFIQYRPAIVLVQVSGEVSVLRARDTIETMLAREQQLPSALATPFPQGLPE